MSEISGISGNSYSVYQALASGSRLNSAADGAAELTQAQEMTAETTGYDVGTKNMQMGQSVLNISASALQTVTDSLQRIRELAVSASNTAVLTDADRQSIQDEIEQMKRNITDVTDNTSYNGKKLLDGSNDQMNIETGSGGKTLTMAKSSLEELGIADFDVTGDFDLSVIDRAIDQVSQSRSSIGAQSNTLDYAINYNSNASYQLTSATSKLEDLDYPEAISEQKKQQTLQNYSMMMQKKQQESEENRINKLLGGI